MPRTIVKKMSHPDPLPDPARVTLRRRIEWIDTDAAGIYHWTTAFRLAEAAEAALHTALGIADQTFGATPRVGVAADFRRSLRFNDAVDVELAVEGLGRPSVGPTESRCPDISRRASSTGPRVAPRPGRTASASAWRTAGRTRPPRNAVRSRVEQPQRLVSAPRR